ncbi:MAG: hypothetical protein EPO08_01540 [Rhodospirillaceae bacterium]|nr:MAG: hypothetical protein EPO08_01540 [Rhodospirillaceae bacterium]
MNRKPDSEKSNQGTSPAAASSAREAQVKGLGQAHLITIENLIVHKYSDHSVLLNKADKVARQIINGELREGEYLRIVRPGRYHLHFPNLRPDAGELRCSVITAQLYRAIRDLNPAAQQLDNEVDKPLAPGAEKPLHKDTPVAAPAPRPKAVNQDAGRDAEMMKQSSAAMAAMTGPGALSREELLGSPLGQRLVAEMTIEQSPMWYASQRIIIGHDCIPMLDGASLRTVGNRLRETSADPVEIRATIDTITYERVITILKKNQFQKTRGLVICPVHASTLAHPRYVGAFIATGSGMPPEVQNYLIFLVKEFAMPISRIKVRDAAGYLKPRARGLLVDLPLNTDEIHPCFKEFGFHGARATVSGFGGRETEILKHLNSFAERCERARLRSTVDGLDSSSQTVGALAAGFSYLSGSAIQRRAGEDAKLQDFDVDSLFL